MEFKKIWKVARWGVLAALVVVIALMLQTPPPVARVKQPADMAEDGAMFQTKLAELARAHGAEEPATMRLTSDEVNAALRPGGPQSALPNPKDGEPWPPMPQTQVAFHDDTAVGRFTTDLYGKNVTVLVAGRLTSKDGYVAFEPTEFKIGDMPVPVSLVQPALEKKLAEPENRDKLKLPDFVSSVRVEGGQLVIETR